MPFLLCQPFCTHRNTSSDLCISSIILRVCLVSTRQGCSCAKLNDKGGIGEEEQSVCLHAAHSDSEALPVQAERLCWNIANASCLSLAPPTQVETSQVTSSRSPRTSARIGVRGTCLVLSCLPVFSQAFFFSFLQKSLLLCFR